MQKKVEITSIAFGGKGIGRIDGKVVFVPFTAPGDEVTVEITSDKKGFSEGNLIEVIKPSGIRQAPPCKYYGVCGGCSFQHIDYKSQLEWKQKIFEETLKRIGKVEDVAFDEPAASPRILNYRSRARFHIEGMRWGFNEARSHNIIDIDECPILDPLINKAFIYLKNIFLENRLEAKRPAGLFALELGIADDDRVVASFHVEKDSGFPWGKLLADEEPVLKGFEVRVSPLKKDKGKRIFAEGDRNLSYEAFGIDYSADISVFSQVNRYQNRTLISKVMEYAGLSGTERVADLFCGVGNLTLPLAGKAKKVTGIEASASAVADGVENAKRNSIKNAEFMAEDAHAWLKRNMKNLEKQGIDVVVLDPPRGGDPDVAVALSGIRPEKIIYVSCSPPTLSRDISVLTGCGYKVFRAGLFDMFPQTFHIESIVGLKL
ncbi:MAG: 23S rRNA (uracil(1939)-C(5))-methyltransferase RlmD [Deltaproteobacteria bacterium]|nr:23S rRNA (uracil(1939)-C(5))-methyltransferase RlmD [Deltaproteobacteria bacterium]